MSKTVWIIEKDHEPLVVDGHLVAFDSGKSGTRKVLTYLNRLEEKEPGPYYDGILYARPA